MSKKMKKNILIPLFTLLTSCTSDVNDPIVRFWNNGVMPSQNEMEAYSLCIRKSEEMYPQSIDPDGSKRVPYNKSLHGTKRILVV